MYAAAAILFIVVVFWLVGTCGRSPELNTPPGPSTPNVPSANRTGSTGVLRASGNDSVPVAISQVAYDRGCDLAAAKDYDGIEQLLTAGLWYNLDAGTRCRVIDAGFTNSEVRLLDGPHAGEAVFVNADLIRTE